MTPITLFEDFAMGLLFAFVLFMILRLLTLREQVGEWQWTTTVRHVMLAGVALVAIFGIQSGVQRYLTAQVASEIELLTPSLKPLAIASTTKVMLPLLEEKPGLAMLSYSGRLREADKSAALNLAALIEGNQENYGRAIELASSAISVSPNNPSLYNTRGVLYYGTTKYREALLDFAKAKSISDIVGASDSLKGVITGNSALASGDLGLSAEARYDFDSSLGMLSGRSPERFAYLVALGQLFLEIGDPLAARERIGEALEIASALGDGNKQGDAYRNLAEISHFLGETVKAFHEVQLALQNHSRDLSRAEDLTTLARIEFDLGRQDSALQHVREALSKSLSFRRGIAEQLHLKARIEQRKGQSGQAIEDYNTALSIYDSLGHLRGKADVLYSLGQLQYEAGREKGKSQGDVRVGKPDFEAAKLRFEEALQLYQVSGYKRGIVFAYGGLGTVLAFLAPDKPGMAVRNFEQALQLARSIQYPLGEANQLGNIGIMLKRAQKYELARENLEKSLGIHRKIGYRLGEARQLINLAELALLMRDCPQATIRVKQGIAISREIDANYELQMVSDLHRAIMEHCGQR